MLNPFCPPFPLPNSLPHQLLHPRRILPKLIIAHYYKLLLQIVLAALAPRLSTYLIGTCYLRA